MRIAFLTHQWPGARLGGLGAYTLHCAHALAEAGHEAHVFTFTLPADVRAALPAGIALHEVHELAERVQTSQLPGPLAAAIQGGGEAVYRMALGQLLCQALREYNAQNPLDIIEAPECEALSLPLLLNPLPNVPIVTHIHSGAAIRRQGNADAATPETLAVEAAEFATLATADALCAPTAQVIADTQRFFPALGDVSLIPFPLPHSARAFTHAPARQRSDPLRRPARTQQRHARANPRTEYFSAALPRCHHPTRRPRYHLRTRWRLHGHLDAQTLHPHLHARVHFLGEQTGEQITQHLRAASFCVVPSLFENYSFVCCEALAAGRAIIVSSQTGAAELVGDAGLIFDRNNPTSLAAKLEELWCDRPRITELSTKAYHRIRDDLGVQITIPKRIAFYRAAIEHLKAHARRPWPDRLATLPPQYATAFAAPLINLIGTLSGIPNSLTPGTRLLQIMDKIAAESCSPAHIYLYGAGRHTSRLLAEKHLWEQKGHRVVGLIDDHPRFQATPQHLGLPVISCANFTKHVSPLPPATAIVLSTDTFQDQFWEQTAALRAAGIPVFRLYS